MADKGCSKLWIVEELKIYKPKGFQKSLVPLKTCVATFTLLSCLSVLAPSPAFFATLKQNIPSSPIVQNAGFLYISKSLFRAYIFHYFHRKALIWLLQQFRMNKY